MQKEFGEQFLIDSYTGKGGFWDGAYLVKHPRETDPKFELRKKMAWYPNYVKKVVKGYVAHLFKGVISRSFEDDEFLLFLKDVDRQGTAIGDFIKKNFRLSTLVGTVFFLIDKPSVAVKNKAEEISSRAYPYLSVRLPSSKVSQTVDQNGMLTEIGFSEARGDATVYRFLNTTSWEVYADIKKEKKIEGADHNLGVVPVIALHCDDPVKQGDVVAEPWAADIAGANWDLFNQESEKRELFRNQAFSILTLPAENEEDAKKYQGMKISTDNALIYNPVKGGKPDYVAPPDGPIKMYMESMEKTIRMIYELANLEFTGGVQQSGLALTYHFQQANNQLNDFGGQCAKTENAIAAIFGKWQQKEIKGQSTYPKDFNIVDLTAELEAGMAALDMQISPTFDKEYKKKIARSMLAKDVDGEKMKNIETEIDAGPVDVEDRIKKETE